MSGFNDLAQVDLNLLVVLEDLLRSHSTTETAQRLGRTQSAISHALARLRVTLGDPLLVRRGARLRPTSTAERLQGPLHELLERAQALLTGSKDAFDASTLERTFVLAGSDYVEIVLLPRLLAALRREAPRVDVVTKFLGDDVDRAVAAREVDAAFGTRLRALSGIVERSVLSDKLVIVLRRGHPACKQPWTARSYAALDHVLVTPRGLPGSAVDTALEPLGLSRRVVLRTPYFGAAATVVARTDLAAALPARLAAELSRGLGLAQMPVPFALPGFTLAMGYSASFEEDPVHRWVRTRIFEAIAADAAPRAPRRRPSPRRR